LHSEQPEKIAFVTMKAGVTMATGMTMKTGMAHTLAWEQSTQKTENRRWTSASGWAVYVYACFFVVLACMLVRWRISDLFGLYMHIDGTYTKWMYRFGWAWGNWFDFSTFNPFAGLGSTFWTSTPWLNPGAWALELPLPPLAAVELSYLAQFAAYGVTFYLLGRVAGISPTSTICALTLFVVFYMPGFTSFWGTTMHYSLAPFRLVTAAAANLMLASLIMAVKSPERMWLACAAGLLGLIWGVYASVTYFVFDLLIVFGFFVVVLCCGIGSSAARRLLLIGSLLVVATVASGMLDYLRVLASISPRPNPALSDLFDGLKGLLVNADIREAFIAHASTCSGSFGGRILPCIQDATAVLFVPPLLFSLYAFVTKSAVHRAILIYYLPLQFAYWFFLAAEQMSLFGSVNHIGIGNVAFAAHTFVVLPYAIIADALLALRSRLAAAAVGILFALPAVAAVLIVVSMIAKHPHVTSRESALRPIWTGYPVADAETPIVRYLQREIGLERGGLFRGLAATYLGNNSTMDAQWGKVSRYGRLTLSSPYFLLMTTGNPHQNSGLWDYGIPTFDEYAHMITKPLHQFTRKLMSDPRQRFDYRLIRAFELEPDFLRMLGVRFVISDVKIDRPDFAEIERADDPPGLLLYRLDGANIASWSPVNTTVIRNNRDLLNVLQQNEGRLRDHVFLSAEPPRSLDDLVPMRQGSLSFDANRFRFRGESDGWSLALLPLQFSHCWIPETPVADAYLLRANYLLTSLLFKGTVDVSYKFTFGPWRTHCRKDDIAMADMGVPDAPPPALFWLSQRRGGFSR
jgi:hypothetical protein